MSDSEGDMRFENLARSWEGRHDRDRIQMEAETDAAAEAELKAAGIVVTGMDVLRGDGEVRTKFMGTMGPWSFRRAWTYWIAEGPGIPPEYAAKLHEAHGQSCRVDGHCGTPSPLVWFRGFGVGHYHVDTPNGLKALADTIRQVLADGDAQIVAMNADKMPPPVAAE